MMKSKNTTDILKSLVAIVAVLIMLPMGCFTFFGDYENTTAGHLNRTHDSLVVTSTIVEHVILLFLGLLMITAIGKLKNKITNSNVNKSGKSYDS